MQSKRSFSQLLALRLCCSDAVFMQQALVGTLCPSLAARAVAPMIWHPGMDKESANIMPVTHGIMLYDTVITHCSLPPMALALL